jgi:hypothetical protein
MLIRISPAYFVLLVCVLFSMPFQKLRQRRPVLKHCGKRAWRVLTLPLTNLCGWVGLPRAPNPRKGYCFRCSQRRSPYRMVEGNRAVLVTSDLLGFPKTVSDRIRDRIELAHGLSRAQIILSGSHTHGGPVVGDSLRCMYPMNDEQEAAVMRYTAALEDKIIALVDEALNALRLPRFVPETASPALPSITATTTKRP